MTALFQLPPSALLLPRVHGFADDFHGFLTAGSTALWTVTTVTDGTVLQQDAAGGRVVIANGTATIGDNEDCYLIRKGEHFLIAANKPLIYESLTQFTQVSTNTVNSFYGLTDAAAADLLVNDGGGPKTSGSSLAFFTKDGSLNLWVHASLSTTQTSVELTAANSLTKAAVVAGGSSFQRLTIHVIPKNSTQADIEYQVDGVPVYKITDWVFTSFTEAQAVIGVKGGTAAAASVVVDYVFCYQAR